MNRTRTFVIATTVSLAGACSASSSRPSEDGGGGFACPSAAPFVVAPAPPPVDAGVGAPAPGAQWFAFDQVLLGIPSGRPPGCGWAAYGLDLDGVGTDALSLGLARGTCSRIPGSPSGMLLDGPGGLDNNFGGHLAKVLHQLESCFGDARTDASYTLLLRVDAPSGADAIGVSGALYLARDLGRAPARDGTDHWLVDPASLLDGSSLERPVVRFHDGYVRDGTWVSGVAAGQATLPLFLGLGGKGCSPQVSVELDVPIDFPRVVMKLDGSAGILAGAIPVAAISTVGEPAFEAAGACPSSSTYQQMVFTFSQSADLVGGAPSLNDPARQCDAISLGVGFTATRAGVPAGVGPRFTPPSMSGACDAADGGDVGSLEGGSG